MVSSKASKPGLVLRHSTSVQECEGLRPDSHLTNVCTSVGVGWAGLEHVHFLFMLVVQGRCSESGAKCLGRTWMAA